MATSRLLLAATIISLVAACVSTTTLPVTQAPTTALPDGQAVPTVDTATETTEPTLAAEPVATVESAGPEEFVVEPTLAFLAEAKARTNNANSFRFEGYSEARALGLTFGDRANPFLIGEVAAGRSRTAVDRTEFVSERVRATATGSEDFTIRIITDGPDGYVTAPYFALLIEGAGLADLDAYAWTADVANGWGHVALATVSHSDLIGSVDIGTGSTGTGLLDLLDSGMQVLDGGDSEVRGVPTRVLHTDVTLSAIFEWSGQDPNTFLTAAQVTMLSDATSNVEVHVDRDGLIRRIEYATDLTVLEGGGIGTDQRNWQRVDYFDFGANVLIEIPTASLDVTEEMADFVSS